MKRVFHAWMLFAHTFFHHVAVYSLVFPFHSSFDVRKNKRVYFMHGCFSHTLIFHHVAVYSLVFPFHSSFDVREHFKIFAGRPLFRSATLPLSRSAVLMTLCCSAV
jgi:hypothetical protein